MALFGTKKKAAPQKSSGKAKEKNLKKRQARASVLAAGTAHETIRAPWFSEKALIITEKGIYTFAVSPRATKAMIAGAIKEIYNVTPKAIRIVNTPGKRKMMRTRRGIGVRADRRKAYVYLNKGETIQFT